MSLWQKFVTSERFWAAVAALVVSVGVLTCGWVVPEVEEIADKVVKAILIFTSLFIGGKTLRQTVTTPEKKG